MRESTEKIFVIVLLAASAILMFFDVPVVKIFLLILLWLVFFIVKYISGNNMVSIVFLVGLFFALVTILSLIPGIKIGAILIILSPLMMVACVGFLILGFINPTLVITWGKEESKTRKAVLKYSSLGFLGSLVPISIAFALANSKAIDITSENALTDSVTKESSSAYSNNISQATDADVQNVEEKIQIAVEAITNELDRKKNTELDKIKQKDFVALFSESERGTMENQIKRNFDEQIMILKEETARLNQIYKNAGDRKLNEAEEKERNEILIKLGYKLDNVSIQMLIELEHVALESNDSALNDLQNIYKSEAVMADFIEINGYADKLKDRKVYVEGKIINTDYAMQFDIFPSFVMSQKEGNGYGIYHIVNKPDVKGLNENDEVIVYGYISGSNSFGMPAITAMIIERRQSLSVEPKTVVLISPYDQKISQVESYIKRAFNFQGSEYDIDIEEINGNHVVSIALGEDDNRYLAPEWCGTNALGILKSIKEYSPDINEIANAYIFTFYAENKIQFYAEFDNSNKKDFSEVRLIDFENENKIIVTQADIEKYHKNQSELKRLSEEKAAAAAMAEYDTGITYEKLARTPTLYNGNKVKFVGEVIQVLESDGNVMLRLAVDNNFDAILLASYSASITSIRVLNKDNVTIRGKSKGLHTYTSTLGGPITIPLVYVDMISIN